MSAKETHDLQFCLYTMINRTCIFCAILFTAVVPFICINLIGQPVHEDNISHPVHNTVKIKRRFLQHIQKRQQSVEVGLTQQVGLEFNEELDDYFIAWEKNVSAKLTAAISKFEEACSLRLQAHGNKLSQGNNDIDPYVSMKNIPLWQEKLIKCKGIKKTKFFLTSALQVRIYKADKAKWTIKELKQWLHYMFWAGIEHVYICDHALFPSERLYKPLWQYIKARLVTYIGWNHTRIAMTAQVTCYQHIIDRFGRDSAWQIAVDMDEFPFMPSDTQENFLSRYLKSLSLSVTEVSMNNFLMLGNGDRSRSMTIERITRMTPKPANNLDEPVFRPTRVIAAIHHNQIKYGRLIEALDDELRLLHFWGSRENSFGPDSPDLLNRTIKYPELRDKLSSAIRESLISFGESDAFSNCTGQ